MVVEAPAERRWQLDIRSLKAGIAHICKTKQFSDVTIMVGAKIFKAHRLILVARSPEFSRLLVREGEPPVTKLRISNTTEKAFDILLNYIYTDHIPAMDSDRYLVLDVHSAATDYGQDGLREACEKIIREWIITPAPITPGSITPESPWAVTPLTVISLLQMSDVQFLKDLCWEYLRIHAREVLVSDGILEATADTLNEMFERGYLVEISAIDLVTNVVRWSSRYFPNNYQGVREHLMVPNGERQKSLMSWIGFQRLNLQELGTVVNKYPRLITDEEFRMFFMHITAAEGQNTELPVWVDN